jgi:hypothetical protein
MSNGDGNLFYPGLPELPNIEAHQPITSLRMKLLREGIEDYEYLVLFERSLGSEAAVEMAASVTKKSTWWERDLSEILSVRHSLAEAIEKR